MPRSARMDAPGALHHIIVRGIGRRKIIDDDTDRDAFLERLGGLLAESRAACCAWALIPNHALMFVRTGQAPISSEKIQAGFLHMG